jgi:MFS family permease
VSDQIGAVPSGSRASRTLKRTFFSLRTRNFRLYFIGQLISNTGNWLTNIALTLLVLKLTHSGFDVGLLAAFQYGPILLLSAWAGAIADRSDKRKLLLLTQSLEMLESIGLAVVAFMPHPSIDPLFILAAIGGTLLAFDNPLRRSFVSEMVPPEDISNAVVLYSTIVNTSRIFGPALAGLLVVTSGFGWCFTIDAISYLAVIVCLIKMRPNELHRLPPKARMKGEVRAGFRYVLSVPVLWINFAMLAAIGLLAYNFNITLPIFVRLALHGSDASYTILYSLFSCGAVVSALAVANRGLVQLRHVILGAATLGAAMLILSIVPNVGFAVPAMLLLGITGILYTTATTTIVQIESRPEMRGRVLSLQTVLLIGPTAVGGPLLGWMADKYGGRSPIILGGIVCLIAAGFGYYVSKRYITPKLQLAS